jgi:3'(2'), 5'-bisphosphate nucleotidase
MADTDAALARRIAETAGALLLTLQSSRLFRDKALGRVGDRIANDFILDALGLARPEDGILSEERKDTTKRLGHRRVWIVDPLDGTREFSEQRSDWAVHIGLAIDGVAAVGAVALPGLGVTLATDQRFETAALPARLRMLVSRTRPAREAVAVAEALNAELVPMGSAGAKAMAVVRGEAEIYLHTGGQYQWDSCAPIAVARAAGLHTSRVDGSPLRYNEAETYLPDLLICRPELAPRILDLVAALPCA